MMKIVCIALLVALAVARTTPRWHELSEKYTFESYVADFQKGYEKGSPEYELRKATFSARLASVLAHNADKSQTYKRGVNHFSDWTAAEWKSYNQATLDKTPKKALTSIPFQQFNPTGMKVPRTVDYRQVNNPQVLTAVKNQGHCGSCWAHSATESIESAFALLTGQTPVLSQGQINECTKSMFGCGGGSYFAAWDYVSTSSGLNEEWAYPYTDFWAQNMSKAATNTCQNITKKFFPNWPWYPKANVTAMWQVKPNSAEALQEALFTKGPVSVSVAAGTWMDYEHGVFHNNASAGDQIWQIDHAVQAVGYGFDTDVQEAYWIVRNSWGTTWGEDGFIRLYRPSVEPCGLDQGQPVCGTTGVLSNPGFPEVSELKKINV